MAYLSFGLASWLFGDNLLAVDAKVPNSALSLTSSHSEKAFGINGLVPQDIATHGSLNVGSILMRLYETAPTGAAAGRPVPVVGEGDSGRYDTAAVFVPPFPGYPEGRLMLADQAGTKYVFDIDEVREVWEMVASEVTATVEENQETPGTGTDQPTEPEEPETEEPEPETEEDSASGGGQEPDDNATDETGQDTQTPDPETDAGEDGADTGPDPESSEDHPADVPEQSGQFPELGSNVTVYSGRVTTFQQGQEVTDVTVVEGPQYGNLTVNPDLSLALVLTGTNQTAPLSFSLEFQYADGRTEIVDQTISVQAGPQKGGWGLGDFYMLESGPSGDLVVEHGQNHRKVYVSASSDALSVDAIARLEGLSADRINGQFFNDNPEYGATPDLAVDETVGKMIWDGLTRYDDSPSSDWLLFERGYSYADFNAIVPSNSMGESALHPLYVGAWGEGSDPLMMRELSLIKSGATHLVIDGLDFVGGIRALNGENILLNDLTVTEQGLNIQNVNRFTLRDSEVSDVVDQNPRTEDFWASHADRESGIFAKNIDGLLIENSLFDHNGWADDYRFNLSTKGGQPPSIYSHNVYIQGDVNDVTFRDNIVMRAAADGAQLRSGGFVEDNLFIDNNNALLVANGRKGGGDYSLVNGNVITSGAHKETAEYRGGLTQGITAQGMMSSFLDNIVTHMVDPEDPEKKAATRVSQYGIWHRKDEPVYDDTIIYNWIGDETHQSSNDNSNRFVDGLDTDLLDQTTIQDFARSILGDDRGTIEDLANHLSQVMDAGGNAAARAADEIAAYFRPSFEIDTPSRDAAQTLRFVPNDLGEGMRWDNRLNWTSETLPGARPGDSVELAGNWVVHGGTTVIENLDFGSGGRLLASHGRLDVTGDTLVGSVGAELVIENAGQVWIDGYSGSGPFSIDVSGGRFANTGTFTGSADIAASGDGQVLLATDGAQFALGANSRLTIEGNEVDIGFDGTGQNPSLVLLQSDSDVAFVAGSRGFSQLGEFYSGAFGTGGVDSAVVIDGANLHLDITSLENGRMGLAGTLMKADEISGQFDALTVAGLSTKQDLTVMVDYLRDEVMFLVSPYGQGSGKVVLDSRNTDDAANIVPQSLLDQLHSPVSNVVDTLLDY